MRSKREKKGKIGWEFLFMYKLVTKNILNLDTVHMQEILFS